MLPGLRFLLTAIVLSISLLIFGLGAAALLRAAHQEFASLPSRPAPPEPVFSSRNDATIPALAMLRIDDDQAADQETLERTPTENIQAAAQPERSQPVTAPAQAPAIEPDHVDVPASKPEAQDPAEIVPSETRNEATPLTQAPPVVEAPSPVETKLATIETVTPPPASTSAPADAEQASAATPTIDAVETKIATLGGPPVEIETQASPIKARQRSAARAERKREQAERASKRRKMARRPRASRRASQAADPFGMQPFGGGFPGASRTQ